MIHSTALIEEGAEIGEGTSVWDNVHIRHGARLGRNCIVGEKTYIAYDVQIGDHVKINAQVYICALVTIEDFVMIAAHTVFTNDKFPRAFQPDLSGLATSNVTEETLATFVRRGATIGANATIGCGLEIGKFAMVGMGSVVTKNVPDYVLVAGNPAKERGYVCVCGRFLGNQNLFQDRALSACASCGRQYSQDGPRVLETSRAQNSAS